MGVSTKKNMDQLPTTRKDKIPHDHSYLVGNKDVSDGVLGCPQYDDLSIVFRYKDCYWASEYERKLKEQGEIRVLSAKYTESWREWHIEVVALPKEYRHNANHLLTSEALPDLKRWFMGLGNEEGTKSAYCGFVFDLYRQVLTKSVHQC